MKDRNNIYVLTVHKTAQKYQNYLKLIKALEVSLVFQETSAE
jgi:hypothetical protein